ncbi:protein expanded [Prorops nasuta]|uniref:protein expanded n=1 Tax=Prorops nasuta TaxID=863751 RepID=UPI0034CD77FF
MRGSGVTAARSCLQPLVSASRYLAVHALPGDPLYFVVEAKSRVKEVYAQTCIILSQQGMQECELFGLAILSDGEYLFVDSENKLSKYAPKNWRNSHTYGLDSSGRPAFVLYFRVRYYVDAPLLLSDETTRHHYYLQLRDNVVRHGGGVENLHPQHPLQESAIVGSLLTLAGLALQADQGDYSEERHRLPHAGFNGYCKPTDYLPAHMCTDTNILSVLSEQHRENRGLSREDAELQYIREAMRLDAPLNAHLYRLRRSKNEVGPGRILLAISARGVRVYGEENAPRVFSWNNIGKLCFDRKKFEIRAVDQSDKLTLYSGCDDKSKLLLALCRDTHQFSMAIAQRVTEAKQHEEEGTEIASETSGVYTLRSSEMQDETMGNIYSPRTETNESSAASDVCTLSSAQSATDEASVTSGFYTIHSGLRSETSDTDDYSEHRQNEDQEPIYSVCEGDEEIDNVISIMSGVSLDLNFDESRSRSNSLLSSGSFRGDGSDPSSIRPLLSADELSDLIVGRYPPRKTISNSMDSDSDYVTMPPPPPPPPPRTDSDKQRLMPSVYSHSHFTQLDYATIDLEENALAKSEKPVSHLSYSANDDYLSSGTADSVSLSTSYTLPRERIQIPPPTPPRNDAITPREPPPPPPPAASKLVDIKGVNQAATLMEKETVCSPLRIQNHTAAIGDPVRVVPLPPKSSRLIHPPVYPGDKMKPTPVHAPVAALVVGPNNYLDVRASRAEPAVLLPYLTPPLTHPRQPPPPPPPPPPLPPLPPPSTPSAPSSLATVYTNQLSRSQIEQYKQQLYSDVDYVMFPLKDPAISKQEYIDAKQGSLLAAMAVHPPPPSYPRFNNKTSVLYRSTPYLPDPAATSISKYASNVNLSNTDPNPTSLYFNGHPKNAYTASTSSLYSNHATNSMGNQSFKRDLSHVEASFSRSGYDDNLRKCLNNTSNATVESLLQPKQRRLPPPPPPSSYEIQNMEKSRPLPSESSTLSLKKILKRNNGLGDKNADKDDKDGMLDIRTLREKSRNLDLPLISALCNDRYLLKQTKAFVFPKHPTDSALLTSPTNGSRCGSVASFSKNKYPVSGLSTTQIAKPPRKSLTDTHKHPTHVKGGNNTYSAVSTSGAASTK